MANFINNFGTHIKSFCADKVSKAAHDIVNNEQAKAGTDIVVDSVQQDESTESTGDFRSGAKLNNSSNDKIIDATVVDGRASNLEIDPLSKYFSTVNLFLHYVLNLAIAIPATHFVVTHDKQYAWFAIIIAAIALAVVLYVFYVVSYTSKEKYGKLHVHDISGNKKIFLVITTILVDFATILGIIAVLIYFVRLIIKAINKL